MWSYTVWHHRKFDKMNSRDSDYKQTVSSHTKKKKKSIWETRHFDMKLSVKTVKTYHQHIIVILSCARYCTTIVVGFVCSWKHNFYKVSFLSTNFRCRIFCFVLFILQILQIKFIQWYDFSCQKINVPVKTTSIFFDSGGTVDKTLWFLALKNWLTVFI